MPSLILVAKVIRDLIVIIRHEPDLHALARILALVALGLTLILLFHP